MMELTQQTILILFAAMAAAIFILFILCIVLFVKLNGQKKRYDYFMAVSYTHLDVYKRQGRDEAG